MRSLKLVTLLALGGLLMVSRAEALPLPGAAAVGVAASEDSLRQDVTYVCRRVWRCGSYGCGWRRACYWTPGRFSYAYPYAYAYRPYWRGYPRYRARPHWRHRRHWR